MGAQRRYVPNLKGLICGKVELKGQGLDTTFIMGQALLKKAILLLKMANVRVDLLIAVSLIDQIPFEFKPL